uniref:Uncharacterized protein n=1 Tax=Rhabditophanes sp. KR3021 TaxID=114890 RepID=A0AC35UFD2_9BILA
MADSNKNWPDPFRRPLMPPTVGTGSRKNESKEEQDKSKDDANARTQAKIVPKVSKRNESTKKMKAVKVEEPSPKSETSIYIKPDEGSQPQAGSTPATSSASIMPDSIICSTTVVDEKRKLTRDMKTDSCWTFLRPN